MSDVNLDEFRVAVQAAFADAAQDAVSGVYGFDYRQPLEETFPDATNFGAWILFGAAGDDLRFLYGLPWTHGMYDVVRSEASEQYSKLEELWPCKVTAEEWEEAQSACRDLAYEDAPDLDVIKRAAAALQRILSKMED